jgi:hypothetical protein
LFLFALDFRAKTLRGGERIYFGEQKSVCEGESDEMDFMVDD